MTLLIPLVELQATLLRQDELAQLLCSMVCQHVHAALGILEADYAVLQVLNDLRQELSRLILFLPFLCLLISRARIRAGIKDPHIMALSPLRTYTSHALLPDISLHSHRPGHRQRMQAPAGDHGELLLPESSSC